MTRTDDYAQALNELEQLHNAGKIPDVQYELHKARLIAEATKPPSRAGWIILSLLAVAVLVIILRVIAAIAAGTPQ